MARVRPQGPWRSREEAAQGLLVPIFDLDGTLLDSDAALAGAFVALGVAAESVTFGHVLADECARLGLSLDAYLDVYDHTAALPFPGIEELLAALTGRGRGWGLCSNKHSSSGHRELARLGWQPAVSLFSEDFGGPKRLDLVLETLGLEAARSGARAPWSRARRRHLRRRHRPRPGLRGRCRRGLRPGGMEPPGRAV